MLSERTLNACGRAEKERLVRFSSVDDGGHLEFIGNSLGQNAQNYLADGLGSELSQKHPIHLG